MDDKQKIIEIEDVEIVDTEVKVEAKEEEPGIGYEIVIGSVKS